MEGGSFDPRQWQLQGKPDAAPAAAPGSVPEFWRVAAQGSDAPPSKAHAKPAGAGSAKRLLPYAASLAILALAAAGASIQRHAPQETAQDTAQVTGSDAGEQTPAAPPPANSIERALSLSSPSELEGALTSAGVPASEAKAATADE
jgi:hypothetical protein